MSPVHLDKHDAIRNASHSVLERICVCTVCLFVCSDVQLSLEFCHGAGWPDNSVVNGMLPTHLKSKLQRSKHNAMSVTMTGRDNPII